MVISNLKIGTSYFFTPLEEFAKENIRYPTSYRLENFGYAECDWQKGDKPYERIYGILLDVRSIMQRHPKSSDKDIAELAAKIENYSNIMPSSSSLSPSS